MQGISLGGFLHAPGLSLICTVAVIGRGWHLPQGPLGERPGTQQGHCSSPAPRLHTDDTHAKLEMHTQLSLTAHSGTWSCFCDPGVDSRLCSSWQRIRLLNTHWERIHMPHSKDRLCQTGIPVARRSQNTLMEAPEVRDHLHPLALVYTVLSTPLTLTQ